LRVPAPRFLVRIFLARHVSRCVSALKRNVARRAAMAEDTPGLQRDLKMLVQFEQSLPRGPRLAVIWPLGLLAVLVVAYLLAKFAFTGDPSAKPLAELIRAAAMLDRGAAIDAFKSAHFGVVLYLGMAAIVAWAAAALVIVLLLPAFAVERRLLAEVAGLEERGFAALGARDVHDLEFDLLAHLLMCAPVAFFGIDLPFMSNDAYGWTLGAILLILTVFAGVELRGRYGSRRAGGERRRGRIGRLSLLLVWVLSVVLVIGAAMLMHEDDPSSVQAIQIQAMQIGEKQPIECPERPEPCELEFAVTAIRQNTACDDPYQRLGPGRQFLRFDLDVSSPVDRFSDPEFAANALRLSHWSVVKDGDHALENDIYMYAKCGDSTEAISQPLRPGTHTKPVVVIDAPNPAAFLQLEYETSDQRYLYRWRVPPTGS
jgi:hypothetical protein